MELILGLISFEVWLGCEDWIKLSKTKHKIIALEKDFKKCDRAFAAGG